MDDQINDETIKEILEEDKFDIENGGGGRRFLRRLLVFIILLAAIFLGFILIQQFILDLEAEAIVRAAQTATSLANESDQLTLPEEKKPPVMSETPEPTSTQDAVFIHTATIASQLTSVAEFQRTATKEP